MSDPDQQDRPATWLPTLAAGTVIVGSLVLDHGNNALLRTIALIALAVALPLIVTPFILLQRHGNVRPGDSYMATTVTVDRGPYALVRHPQYLGYMLLVTGFALITQRWLLVLPLVLTWLGFARQATEEERDCHERLGQPYADYCRRIPRFNLVLGLLRWWRRRRGHAEGEAP